ncbi:MAG: thiamine phosphate synthase [Actinobacteria bacterium]|nr:thiamine phosphate synthase [Actinomycetota bacterium]
MSDPPRPPIQLDPPEGVGRLRRERLLWARLYFVCEALPNGREPEPMLQAALGGGAGIVQLRDREQPDAIINRVARTYRRLADTYSAPFIVNDDPALAQELDADGVHVGQEDVPAAQARELMGPEALIGLSTHSAEQIEAAHAEPVDYISVGPVWETPTKQGRPAVGLDLVRHAAEVATLPWFAIGGIDAENVGDVIDAGARRIVVVRAIRDSADPRAVADALSGRVEAAVKADLAATAGA